jgi:GT2 family glycosyltransferase
VFAQAGGADLDVVVMDNASTDGTRELVESKFPAARVVDSVNHGFAHANNQGAITCDARYVLFLNPDTEIVDGTFGEVVELLDARPEVGLAGVRQITGDGELSPTMRRLPSIRPVPGARARLRAVAGAAGLGLRADPRHGSLRAGVLRRLDLRLLHVRAP